VRTQQPTDIDAGYVIARLEKAGSTLLALPGTGWSPKLRMSSLDIVRTAIESYGWTDRRVRPPVPSAAAITDMDEVLSWISFIPAERYVLRRIVGARSLVHPITEKHLFPWRRLGAALGADHKAVQRWHREGIDILVGALLGQTEGAPPHSARAAATSLCNSARSTAPATKCLPITKAGVPSMPTR
jgi:Domain of unknown function (DUF6362)